MFGHPLASLDRIETDSADLAALLADADGRVNGGWGAALLDGQLLHLSSQPGGTSTPRPVTSVESALVLIGELRHQTVPDTVAVHLDLDLDEPVPDDLAITPTDSGVVVTLSPSLAALSLVAVVGPGAARTDVDAVGRVARFGGIGVFNTWGAKGVLRWDSPHHYGTIGLQERDLELAQLDAADIIITVGLDPDELGPDALGSYLVQDVAPGHLAALLVDWPSVERPVRPRPPLYSRIADVVTPMYERSTGPITPPRAALHLSGAAVGESVVVADPGSAGWWIARTFPTGLANSVVVPALAQPGFAAAGALVAGLATRGAVAVLDGDPDESSELVFELAARLGQPLTVQCWHEGSTTVDQHLALTRGVTAPTSGQDTVQIDHVGLDGSCLALLTDAIGAPTAWDLPAELHE